MTFDELAARLRSLGFVCAVDRFDADVTRVIVAKRASTPGKHLKGQAHEFSIEEEGVARAYVVDQPCPEIWQRNGRFDFTVVAAFAGTSPGAYIKEMASAEEAYEE